MSTAIDYISVVCSIIGTVVALVTLVTVYIAVVQLITKRRIARLELSEKSLGHWRDKVLSSSPFKLQTEVSTPRVRVSVLLKKYHKQEWEPRITFPTGVTRITRGVTRDAESGFMTDEVLAETTWVNFLEALSIHPSDDKLYEMMFERKLVNGSVPMRWKGRDLVGICSILGFQSSEMEPSFTDPMPLPVKWSGPLGSLQFGRNPDECIVQFIRRVSFVPQLSKDASWYFENFEIQSQPFRLQARLWQSISGLHLNDNRTLYLGGQDADRKASKKREKKLKPMKSTVEDTGRTDNAFGDGLPRLKGLLSMLRRAPESSESRILQNNRSVQTGSGNRIGLQERQSATVEEGSHELTNKVITDDQIQPEISTTKSSPTVEEESHEMTNNVVTDEEIQPEISSITKPSATVEEGSNETTNKVVTDEKIQPEISTTKSSATVEDGGRTGNLGADWVPTKVEVFSKSPGLLSKIRDGDMANGLGLNFTSGCSQYERVYYDYGDWERLDQSSHPYRIGTLCMGKELLALVKEAALELKPDAYYFSPTVFLYQDVSEFYRHVKQQSDELNEELDDYETHADQVSHIIFPKSKIEEWLKHGPQWVTLFHAMALCNDFQRIRKPPTPQCSIEDMRIVSKAAECLREILMKGIDLIWAIIVSPELFHDMLKRYRQMDVEEVVKFEVISKNEIIYLPSTDPAAPNQAFKIPLMRDATFSSLQVLAAFVHVFLTYFWIAEKWISDVRAYATTIPDSVAMC